MTYKEIYEAHYVDYCSWSCCDTKYEWAASQVFNLVTYDGGLDELFVKKIIEVSKVILEKRTFEYIEDETNYIEYILVCQLLVRFNWLNWGTSIRGAWFEFGDKAKPLLDMNLKAYGFNEICFTPQTFEALIEFLEEEEDA